jgi:hypothetical protein
LNPLLDSTARVVGQELLQGVIEPVSSQLVFDLETLLN